MKFSSFLIASAATIVLTACGGGSSSSGNNANPTSDISKPTAITNNSEAESALYAAQTLMGNNSATGIFNSFSNTSSAPKLRQVVNCNSGSMNINATSQTDVSALFSNCSNEPGTVLNGEFSMKANSDSTSGTFTLKNFTMKSPEGSYSFNLTMLYSSSNGSNTDLTLDGSGSLNQNGNKASFIYDNLKVSSGSNGTTINGTIGVDYTPDLCGEGTYAIKTIHPLYGTTTITSGELEINGANYVYHADGTVTITVNGTSTTIDQNALNTTCS